MREITESHAIDVRILSFWYDRMKLYLIRLKLTRFNRHLAGGRRQVATMMLGNAQKGGREAACWGKESGNRRAEALDG
jgi:hypothetical protein